MSKSVLTPGQKKHKKRQTIKNGYETEILIQWISLKIDEHSGFHSLFICAKFECSTISRTKNIKVLKSQPVNASSSMKSLKSHTKCSQVEILNLNSFCSIHCGALKFSKHKEKLEPILLTIFNKKSKVCFIPCWVCFCCACIVCGFSSWWQNTLLINPSSSCLYSF